MLGPITQTPNSLRLTIIKEQYEEETVCERICLLVYDTISTVILSSFN